MNVARVFALTLLALRADTDGTQLTGAAGASTVLTVQTSQAAAEAEGWQAVHEKYPQADGWFGHQVTAFELPNPLDTDGYHVVLHISKSGDAREELESEQRWATAFASSQAGLLKLAEQARANYLAGKTEPLDPDQL